MSVLIIVCDRVFLCASSPDESGREALDWALENLVQDGDELVVYRGVEEDVLGQLVSYQMLRISLIVGQRRITTSSGKTLENS